MKEFVLRDLTEKECEKFNSFIANDTAELYQYFMAIIITDLIPEGEISLEKALEKVADDQPKGDPREDPDCVCGLIDAWIRLCTEYKNYGLVDSLDRLQVRGLGYYWDYGCKVELGVINGKGYARDIELDEEDWQ